MRLKNLLLILVLAYTVPAHAADYAPYWINYGLSGGLETGGFLEIKGEFGCTDGYDSEGLWSPISSDDKYNMAIYKANGAGGWNGINGLYINDERAPWTGQKMVFDNIYAWAGANVHWNNLKLYQSPMSIPSDMTYKLILVTVPNGIYYDGPKEWGPGETVITLPFYRTSDGLTGYKFRLELTAVPEPSSLLALAGGLATAGGAIIRRRKKVF